MASCLDSTRCLRGWKLLTPGRTRKLFSECVVINRSKTGRGGSTADGRGFLVGTSPAARSTTGAADLFGDKFVVLRHCAARRWTMHENQSYRCPPSSCIGSGVTGWKKVSVHSCRRETKKLMSFPFSYHPVPDRNLVKRARHLWPQHRSSNERKASL